MSVNTALYKKYSIHRIHVEVKRKLKKIQNYNWNGQFYAKTCLMCVIIRNKFQPNTESNRIAKKVEMQRDL